MSDELAKLEKSFNRVRDMQPVIETMLAEWGDSRLCKGSNVSLADLVRAYSELIDGMADVIAERKMSPDLEKALIKVAMDAAKDATGLPEGSLIVQAAEGADLGQATVLVLHKASKGLIKELVKKAIGCLMGGTDDTLSAAETIAPALRADIYSAPHGWSGAPVLGKAIVTKADSTGMRKAAGGPTEPESEIKGVFDFLLAAAAKKVDQQVNLT